MGTRADTSPGAWRRTAPVALAVAVAAVGLVSLVHHWAAPRIAANQHAARVARLTAVLGDTRFDNDVLADRITVRDPELLGSDHAMPVYRARLGDQPVAALLEVVAPGGYGGEIHLLVAVRPDGKLIGVQVLSHNETPGVGDAVDPRRSGWLGAFEGRALGDPPLARWAVRKDGGRYDQMTGATVTSRAVVAAVRDALRWYETHRERAFAAPSDPSRAGD